MIRTLLATSSQHLIGEAAEQASELMICLRRLRELMPEEHLKNLLDASLNVCGMIRRQISTGNERNIENADFFLDGVFKTLDQLDPAKIG